MASLFALLLVSPALASLPLVDFNRMGQVGLAGAFAGLSLFDNASQITVDPSASTLLSRSSDGELIALASTNQGGQIYSGCAIGDVYYVAGSFSSLGSASASNIASFTPSSASFASLGANGPSGPVHALYCDTNSNQLWAGGVFTSPGSSVAVYDTKANQWSAPSFKGFSGSSSQVLAIVPNASDSSLFFLGSFTTSFQGNGTVPNNNNPNVPYSAGATPFSSSLVPIPLQNAEITAGPSTTNTEFSNIQNILCPAGPDGPGNTWLAENGTPAQITIRAFSALNAYGVRLGNTFQSGFGTTAFTVTSVPDNIVQPFQYIDPQTGQNVTCSDSCPLSTNSSLPYQDFIFANPTTLSGVQITLSAWTGQAAGLHMLQLLSAGAFASAVPSQNGQSCFAPNPSNVTTTGTWTAANADTSLPGTIQSVQVATVNVGTPASQAPTYTWMPYVSASGEYEVNMVVPGCGNFGDCPLRTSVQVEIFPGGGQQGVVTTVSQQNVADVSTLIYRGPIVPSSPSFVTTVTMSLASNPSGTGQNGQYELVAGNIELVLTSANVTGSSGGSGGNGTTGSGGIQHGFGFFEWPLHTSNNADATGTLPNSTETMYDLVGFSLYNGINSASVGSSSIAAAVQHPSGSVFLGGSFNITMGSASGTTNFVVFEQGQLVTPSNFGLNGAVTSMILYGEKLFVGGSFSSTRSTSSNGGLSGVAVYDIQSRTWAALGGGVNGPVESLNIAANQLQIVGNFSTVTSPTGATYQVGGLAVWDIASGAWLNSGGFLSGHMSFVGNSSSAARNNSLSQFISGNVAELAEFGATGLVMLSNGNNGPTVSPLQIPLEGNGSGSTAATVTKRRRSHVHHGPTSWIPHLTLRSLFKRQSGGSQQTLPEGPPTPAPAVLAGAFWANSSSSKQVSIIGGNFTFASSSHAVGIYDASVPSIQALQGNQINGIVRSLKVVENQLFVGGQFSLSGTNANGLALYNLQAQQWNTSNLPPLQASSGSTVEVRSISSSASKPNAIIVAGTFTGAGSVGCQAVCELDTSTMQWSTLGSGIQGQVSSVSYAGNNQEYLIAAGSITLSGGSANVAMYSFSSGTWNAVGDGSSIPGPVTALEVDNSNSSSIFAAGRTLDGSSAFMYHWNGATWNNIGSGLQGTSNISQLLMVPLQNAHSTNSIVESDRMLMVSGSLAGSTFAAASSVLFDGASLIPFVSSVTTSGSSGFVASLFYSLANFSFTQQHFLATGIVILISIAIAAGVVFLLALIGILWTLFSRKDDKVAKLDGEDDDSSIHHRPSSLLEHINAATRTTILGGGQSPFNDFSAEKDDAAHEAVAVGGDPDPFGPDASNYLRAQTPSDAHFGTMVAEEEFNRPAHARYSFDGAGDGELPMAAGLEVEILDDRDAAWWYARNPQTGQEGVVPAAYLY
ncbi:hypothetical protein CONPUDRAFT_81100 [Coniophora puteana RWD-64-598 SS2]|uniref:SH3 domain-containing protein n=1 Tax=Coniophora puteana (strain RWD-64-598) TaxID=741705 RepID=A0A5M3MWL7_CONPW|nr:uncharacterized protein CONPUDRAFT_81100 [Coniophora puteana RWD-64-598 SS2]EIW82991.1 hypothetical protein CONPUDRAFT_81100 [Coniophora puteana RWD-64-598 SS2]